MASGRLPSDNILVCGLASRLCKVVAGLLTSQVNTHLLLAFMEYLHANHQSKVNISNYIAAIRAFHVINISKSYFCFLFTLSF